MSRRLSPAAQLGLGLAVLTAVLAAVVGAGAVGVGLWAKSRSDAFVALPSSLPTAAVPERSVLLDARGTPFAYFWDQDRQSVPASQMAPSLRQAAVAVEDSRFWTNKGVDLQAMVRALVHNATSGGHEGGSTITQQYVKNLLLVGAHNQQQQQAATALTGSRKLAEARYALAITRRMSKDDILTGYLNIAYFGEQAYGAEAAAETFFGTDAGHLTLPQSALLAGLVKSPSDYDPFVHPQAATARRNLVLDRLRETRQITAPQAQQAQGAPLGLQRGGPHQGCAGSTAGYFCDWVQRTLVTDPALGGSPQERLDRLRTGGLTIRTTLDPQVQESVQHAVDRAKGARPAAASVVVEPGRGAVLGMAASVPFGVGPGRSSVNLPLGGSTGFQAGSTFKVFVLTAALEQGIPLGLRMDAPNVYESRRWPPYTVHNAADSENGVFTLEQATWHSVNTYYLQLEERVGLDDPARIAESLGVRRADGRPLQRFPSFTLGTNEVTPLAMAGALATYAAHGRYCPAYGIAGIAGAPWPPPPACTQVLDPRIADTVTQVLQGVIREGTGTNAQIPGDAAGKTGTVQDFSAAWFVGYTRRYAAAVWMGDPRGGYAHPLVDVHLDGRSYTQMYGGDEPARIWAAALTGAPGGRAGVPFDLGPTEPSGSGGGAPPPPAAPQPPPDVPPPAPPQGCSHHGNSCHGGGDQQG